MPSSIKSASKHKDIILRYAGKYPNITHPKLAKIIIKEENIDEKYENFAKKIKLVLGVETMNKAFSGEQDLAVPDSLYIERPHYIIPSSVRKLLVIGDLHIPFHDIGAIRTALAYGDEKGVDGILLNGDIGDFYSFSRFVKRPDLRRPKEEIEMVANFLSNLRNKYPNYKLYYKFGNHEDRWDRYVIEKASDLWQLPGFSLRDLLKLDQLRIEHIDERTVIEFGKLSIIHGHEIWGGGINVARNFRIKSRVSILFNHFHRYQTDIVPTLDNKHQGAWAVGCLCGLRPDYMPVNDWLHGVAIIERDKEGYFTVNNKQIMNGRII